MDISTNLIPLADGNQMPAHGFGVYKITDDQELIKAVTHAYQVGYRLFDTAQMYEHEAALGKALKELNQPRDNYFITTKVGEKPGLRSGNRLGQGIFSPPSIRLR